jgi:hypothetical protein
VRSGRTRAPVRTPAGCRPCGIRRTARLPFLGDRSRTCSASPRAPCARLPHRARLQRPTARPMGIHPVRDPFTFTAPTSPSAATMVINTCRKCAPRAAGDREPHAARLVAARPASPTHKSGLKTEREHSLKVDLFLCFSRLMLCYALVSIPK